MPLTVKFPCRLSVSDKSRVPIHPRRRLQWSDCPVLMSEFDSLAPVCIIIHNPIVLSACYCLVRRLTVFTSPSPGRPVYAAGAREGGADSVHLRGGAAGVCRLPATAPDRRYLRQATQRADRGTAAGQTQHRALLVAEAEAKDAAALPARDLGRAGVAQTG